MCGIRHLQEAGPQGRLCISLARLDQVEPFVGMYGFSAALLMPRRTLWNTSMICPIVGAIMNRRGSPALIIRARSNQQRFVHDTCHMSFETFALSLGFSSVDVSDIDFPNVQVASAAEEHLLRWAIKV